MRHLTILTAGAAVTALVASSALAAPGVATGNVNLRAADTVNSQRLATIPQGAPVEVHSCPTWCHLTYNGITGWASPNYIATGQARRDDRRDSRRYSYRRDQMPPSVYWEFGRPSWDSRYGYWRDPRDRWWHDGRWHHRRPGVTFQFGF